MSRSRFVKLRRVVRTSTLAAPPTRFSRGRTCDILHVDGVDPTHVDLAQDPAEVPPAAGAVAVERRRAASASGRSCFAARRPRRRACCGPPSGSSASPRRGSSRCTPSRAGCRSATPWCGSCCPRSGPSRSASPSSVSFGTVNSLRYQPTFALVLGRVLGVPVERDRDGRPAGEVVLRVPALLLADEGVVLSRKYQVPPSSSRFSLALADQRLAAGRLDAQLRSRRRRRGGRRGDLCVRPEAGRRQRPPDR